MTAEAAAGLAADFANLPTWTLDERQLGDTELLLLGAFAPLTGFLGDADVASVSARGTLADGTPWPVPVVLDVPEDAVPRGRGQARAPRPRGHPAGHPGHRRAVRRDSHRVRARGPARPARRGRATGLVRLAGPVTGFREPEHGPFRQLRRPPGQVRAELGGGPVLAFATRRPLSGRQIGQLRHFAGQLKARLLLLPLVGGPAEVVVRPEALVRAVQRGGHAPAAGHPGRAGPAGAAARSAAKQRAGDPGRGRGRVRCDAPAHGRRRGAAAGGPTRTARPPRPPIPVLPSGDWAYDPRRRGMAPAGAHRAGHRAVRPGRGRARGPARPGRGGAGLVHAARGGAELRRARPPRGERGVVVFFTGLSGSGKSTIARALARRAGRARRPDRVAARRRPGPASCCRPG